MLTLRSPLSKGTDATKQVSWVSLSRQALNAAKVVAASEDSFANRPEKMQATGAGSTPVPSGQNMSVNNMPVYLDTGDLLDGFYVEGQENREANPAIRIYEDIYDNDPVLGLGIDLMAVLPYQGGFAVEQGAAKLTEEELDIYRDNILALDFKRNIPKMERERMIAGRSAAVMLMELDEDDNKPPKIADLLFFDSKTVNVKPSPLSRLPPKITGSIHREFLTGLRAYTQSAEMNVVLERLYGDFLRQVSNGKFEANPTNTLYVINETRPNSFGVSALRRALPLWFYEKNLFRATLGESVRRVRGVTHMTLGDDTWAPLPEDFNAYVNALQQAAADPISAIYATRPGVSFEDILEGGSFWKVDDLWGTLPTLKCRALGIPESLVSMDGSFALEGGIQIVLDLFKDRRDYIYSALLRPVLVLVAFMNKFLQDNVPENVRELVQDAEDNHVAYLEFLLRYGHVAEKYLRLPKIRWTKSLDIPVSTDYLDMLDKLAEKGWPVPFRILAAATGFDPYEILNDQNEDIKLRERFAQYVKETAKFATNDDDDGGFSGGASPTAYSKRVPLREKPMQAVANASAEELSGIFKSLRTGKRKP